jgi:DNA-binding PadR family transcriptional regulator
MFGNEEWQGPHPAFAWGGDPNTGWQPWARGGWVGPRPPMLGRMFWRMARRFPFGPGMGPGMRPAFPRMFGHGHLKYVLLDLLQERPKHGYEMIKELEERSSGFYTPSAGAVYPTLQLLEDRGWVTSQTVEGKKVYAITDPGREALKGHKEQQQQHEHQHQHAPDPDAWGADPRHHEHGFSPFGGGPFGRQARPELRALRHESMEVARLMRAAVLASGGDPERLTRLRTIVERTRDELNAFLGQQRSSEPPTGEPAPAHEGPIEHV